jgi:hypothetical protein
MREKALGPEHPDTATSLNNLAGLYRAQGRYSDAYRHSSGGIAILRDRFSIASDDGTLGRTSEQKSNRFTFLSHVDLSLRGDNGIPRLVGEAEAFAVVQLAQSSEAAEAVSRMAARFAVGDDDLAKVVRETQDKRNRIGALDKQLIQAISAPPDKRDKAKEATLRRELTSLNGSLSSLNEKIAVEFPSFAELTRSKPLTIAEVQEHLSPREALVLVSRAWDDEKSHVFVVRDDGHEVFTVDVGAAFVREAVTELRLGIELRPEKKAPAFDTSLAYKLYRALLGPAEDSLEGAEHVFFVVDGLSIPLVLWHFRLEFLAPLAACSGTDVDGCDCTV